MLLLHLDQSGNLGELIENRDVADVVHPVKARQVTIRERETEVLFQLALFKPQDL